MKTKEIQEKYGLTVLSAEVLSHANLSENQIEQILFPKDQLQECVCPALEQLAARIKMARQRKEKVFIGGDYDADGLCATVILKEVLDALEIENGYYIPNRFTQGYGLHPETVRMVKEKGYSLIITVDNGVAAQEAIEECHRQGLEIYVTDHHMIQSSLNWDGLVHPSDFPEGFKTLCGAGVALQISRRLIKENRKHVILAMVATLADMMPLFDENRRIVRLGLKYLNETPLLQLASLVDRPFQTWDERVIAFQIVPKINAIGRLADQVNPNNVVRFFLMESPQSIRQLAEQIKQVNARRRQMSEKMVQQAEVQLNLEQDFLILADERFHEGLVGLAANRLMMAHHRPTAVFAKKETYKGSVRSWGSLNLIDFFEDLKPLCLHFGGHASACGIEIAPENFDPFQKAVAAKMKLLPPLLEQQDRAISISSQDCTLSAVRQLMALAPFGQGFEQPIFRIQDFVILQTQILKERYPKWKCRNDQFEFEAISFALPKTEAVQSINKFIGQLQINEFRGKQTLSILVENIE